MFQKQIQKLKADGWILIKGLLSKSELAAMHNSWDNFEDQDNNITWDVMEKLEFLPCIESTIPEKFLPALLGDNFELVSLRGRSPKPGLGLQGLHVDTAGPVSPDEQQLANAFWVLDKMSKSNGATRLVPRSHVSYSVPSGQFAQPGGKHPDEVYISADPGDLLLFSSHLWHSGSKNSDGTRRRIVIAQYRRVFDT